MLTRTLNYVLGDVKFKVLASGRTDAKVSVNQTYIELFVDEVELDLETFFPVFNLNLPQDIRALDIVNTTADFNIIQHPKEKEYCYLFAHGGKSHPFSAPLLMTNPLPLDIIMMKKAAKLFEGTHDFKHYTYKPNPETNTTSTINECELISNTTYKANFFPEKTYMLRVVGSGFKRHQIRLMMGALLELGEGKVDLYFIEQSLQAKEGFGITRIAPASGLILQRVEFSI
ncbi:tRNA pseudouridine(38-40) synthase TruA [Gangjinia marincola]|uniref:tRNA pseudouridine synthase n=2 Tax=Gangjinia marincola TaxID=578463 RepID=A0ABN1MGY9_9FLAO